MLEHGAIKGALDLDNVKTRTSAQSKEVCAHDDLCAALTAMVALWKSLSPGETRHGIVKIAQGNLKGMNVPGCLSDLMTKVVEGGKTFFQ